MKHSLFTLFTFLTFSTFLSAQVFTESFEYAPGSTLDSNGWNQHSGSSGPISVDAASLTFNQYSPTSIGGSAVSTGTSQDVNAYFGPIASGDVYASFLLKVDTINSSGYFFHFMEDVLPSFAFRARTFFRQDATNSNAFNLGLHFNSSTAVFDTTEFSFGSTILVVVKYSIISGSNNDEVRLYAFNANDSFTTEPSSPLIGPITASGTQNDIDPARIALRQFSSNGGFTVDAFSINTTWNMSPAFTLNQIDLPITWDDNTVDYTVTDFGGNISSVIPSPTNASNHVLETTKDSTAQTWAGTTLSVDSSGLATAIPFSMGNTVMKVAVWSPDANIPIRLKAEDKSDPGKSVETETLTTVAAAWDTLSFDFSNQATGTAAINFTYTYDKLSIFYNFGTDGATAGLKTYYSDNVWYVGGSTPSLSQIDLPITWDDTTNVDYTTTDFGGNTSMVVVSPTNNMNNVLQVDKGAAAQTWAGTTLSTSNGLATAIPFSSGNTEMKVAVWSPDSGTVIRLKVENHLNSAISVETDATTGAAAAWDTLTFDFANQAAGTPAINFANTYDMASIFFDFGTVGGATAKTYYCDNVWFTGPSAPPPSNNSPYCNTLSYHFGNSTDVTSSIFLTIKNTGSNSMEVVIESATSDPVDDLIIPSGSGAAISAIDTPMVGQLRRILTWTTPPPTVDLNVLWSKGTFGGNWQLQQVGNISIPFAATCSASTPTKAIIDLPITWDDSANVDYTVTDFGGNFSAHVVDPTNAMNMVLQSTKDSTAQTWAGTTLGVDSTGLATAIPFSMGNTVVQVAVWSPDANIPVRLKAEDKTDGTKSVETEAIVVNAGVWDTLTFDFSNQAMGTTPINFTYTYDKLSIFYNFGTDGATAGLKTYYCDDVYFMSSTPPPTSGIIDLPITWDDTANVDYTVTDFGGNFSAHVVDPTNASNMVLQTTKDSTAQTWAGTTLGVDSTGLATAIPFSMGNTSISVAVWSPDANIPVRLKAEDKTDPTKSVETEAMVMNAGVWDTLTFDFSNQAAGTAPINFTFTYDKLSIFYNFGTDGATAGLKTYYCDDVYFGMGTPPVGKAVIDLPITWDDSANVDYTVTDFGGNFSAHVVDPTNASNMVLQTTKDSTAQTWSGTTYGIDVTGLATAIPFSSGNTLISVAVWSPDANIPVRLKAEDKSDPTKSVETEAMVMNAGVWDTLVFDFSNQAAGTAPINFTTTYDKLSIFYNFGTDGATAGLKTYYCDDVYFGMATPPPPSKPQIDMPITWNDTANVDYTVTDFGGNASMLTQDPTNASNLVLMSEKTSGAMVWAGTTLSTPAGFANAIPFAANDTKISCAIYSPTVGTTIRLKAEDHTDGTKSVETEAMTTVANAWDTIVFDFSNEAAGTSPIDFNNTYDMLSIFYDFNNAPATPGNIYYLDDVFFGTSGGNVGIEENWVNDFKVFPNPNQGEFRITGNLKVTREIEITVTDLQGRVIYQSGETGNTLDKSINLGNVTNGIYLVKITSEAGSVTERISIAK